jgi:hypothetical protein
MKKKLIIFAILLTGLTNLASDLESRLNIAAESILDIIRGNNNSIGEGTKESFKGILRKAVVESNSCNPYLRVIGHTYFNRAFYKSKVSDEYTLPRGITPAVAFNLNRLERIIHPPFLKPC